MWGGSVFQYGMWRAHHVWQLVRSLPACPAILAYSLVFSGALLIFLPLAGRLYDRRGLAAVLVPVLVILAAGFGVLAAAKDLTMFLVAASLTGVGYGAVQPSLQAMAVQDVAPDRRGAANATFYTAFDLGIGIGAMGLGLLVGRFSYPSIYLVSAILTLVALGICAVSFKRTPGPAVKGPAHSQAIPSPSRSSWVRYPGSPR
ncbi:MFS transporter [Kyrpidia sp.]|uniref:MFS transporter n=1 Tax=Kyrpidia sp. TaxID=2073077 RepID=UPI00258A656D|nr:MFS transporter [Kyrpidia sp.]MCL6574546.1 MFS transporter [Kyrpidia sp.]